jgi:hypothetical protein
VCSSKWDRTFRAVAREFSPARRRTCRSPMVPLLVYVWRGTRKSGRDARRRARKAHGGPLPISQDALAHARRAVEPVDAIPRAQVTRLERTVDEDARESRFGTCRTNSWTRTGNGSGRASEAPGSDPGLTREIRVLSPDFQFSLPAAEEPSASDIDPRAPFGPPTAQPEGALPLVQRPARHRRPFAFPPFRADVANGPK